MDKILELMSDIVSSEYAQWMRYTYLSALGFGLNTDVLTEHFREHASDELEHAATINRWIFDLGGIPTTSMPTVEQLCGDAEAALNWLVQYEMSGINKYMQLFEITTGMIGLQADIEQILSTEHEHLSDLMKLLPEQEDPTIIIVANNKIAASYRDFLNWLKPKLKESGVSVPSALPKVVKMIVEDKVMNELYPLYNRVKFHSRDKDQANKVKMEINQYIHYMKQIENANEDDLAWLTKELGLEQKDPMSLKDVEDWASDWPIDPPNEGGSEEQPDDELSATQRMLEELKSSKPKEEPRRPVEKSIEQSTVKPMVKDHDTGNLKPAEIGMGVYNQEIKMSGGPEVKKRMIGIINGFAPSGELIVTDGTGARVQWNPKKVWTDKKQLAPAVEQGTEV